jgi:succinyl-CoA synthetase beta subunit
MQLYEFEAKDLLREFGIASPRYRVAASIADLEKIVHTEKLEDQFLKVQIHAGGRGKAGGIVRARTPGDILEAGRALFGKTIINEQTGPDGLMVSKILLSDPIEAVHEYYLGMVIADGAPYILASRQGGMEIETLAKESPEAVLRLGVFRDSPHKPASQKVCEFLGLPGDGEQVVQALIELFFSLDALLVEINPLSETRDGKLWACDAKMTLDEDAQFRHPELPRYGDLEEQDPLAEAAKKQHLSYVKLSGDVGTLVNGAGLAMATVDLLQEAGIRSANFLDIGGQASQEKIEAGLDILFQCEHLRAIVINIFGGIVDCDLVAQALIGKLGKQKNISLVVRLEGKNSQKAKDALQSLSNKIVFASSFEDIAKKVQSIV